MLFIHDLKHERFWWLDARAPLSWQRCGRVPWTPGPIAEAVHGWRSIRVGRQTGFRHFTVGFMGYIYIYLEHVNIYVLYIYISHCNIFLIGVRLMFSIFPGTTVATTAASTTSTTTPLQLQHEQLQLQLQLQQQQQQSERYNHNYNCSHSYDYNCNSVTRRYTTLRPTSPHHRTSPVAVHYTTLHYIHYATFTPTTTTTTPTRKATTATL